MVTLYLFLLSLWTIAVSLASAQITTTPRAQPKLRTSDKLRACCSIMESTELLACINQSSAVRMKHLGEDKSEYGPHLTVGIVSYATTNIWNYSALSFGVNEFYAEHNNYLFVMLDPIRANYDENDSRWNKVKILEDALHPATGWGRHLDYLMWVDADLIFLDMGLRLEKVAAEYPSAHLIASAGNHSIL
jgi:hypothetical protein